MASPDRAGLAAEHLLEEVTEARQDKHGRWINPWSTWKFPSKASLLWFLLLHPDHSDVPTSREVLDAKLPVQVPYFVRENVEGAACSRGDGGLRVTWLGHSTVLVELDGLRILTDPMFSQRASFVQLLGPKRYRGPPCTVDQLPRIDAVVISHSHYDHLDARSVASLNDRFGEDLHWFVPAGLGAWLRGAGCLRVTELRWWEESAGPVGGGGGVTFACTPAQHWSRRSALDRDRTLWCSWALRGRGGRFFFAGDTGYCPAFTQIGARYGPFTLAAIPIGAYQPRSVMEGQHVDPPAAVQIHVDVRAERSLAVHWGTFALAHEHYLEPPLKLRQALEEKGLPADCFFTLDHGETWTDPRAPTPQNRAQH